jgi:hypothetical protein
MFVAKLIFTFALNFKMQANVPYFYSLLLLATIYSKLSRELTTSAYGQNNQTRSTAKTCSPVSYDA